MSAAIIVAPSIYFFGLFFFFLRTVASFSSIYASCGIMLLRVSRDRLKESYVLRKVRHGAKTAVVHRRLVFVGTSGRDLKSKFCIRHFEVNAEHTGAAAS